MIFPRKQAIRVLTQVLSERKTLEDALAEVSVGLTTEAIAWLQEVCSGTLRWRGRLDWVLDSVALKKKPTGWLRKVLLLAAYQLIVQDRVHPGAIVSETVSETRRVEGEAPARFVNACLRQIASHARQWRNLEVPAQESASVQAAWASLPQWLWDRIVKEQGMAWAISYAQASLDRPTLWIRSRVLEKNPMWEGTAGPLPDSWQLSSGRIESLPGFLDGAFFVQDISNQLLVHEVSLAVRAQLSDPIEALDLCAAPGGKSIGLAWNGIRVSATDPSLARYRLLRENQERLAPDITLVPWENWTALGAKSLVWVDAPCSGSGILRRHPDVRWLREEKHLAELVRVQSELIRHAWKKVELGGFLVYSVCSVLKEEGPNLISAAVHSGDFSGRVIQEWCFAPQTFPHGDGFWAALLQKTG